MKVRWPIIARSIDTHAFLSWQLLSIELVTVWRGFDSLREAQQKALHLFSRGLGGREGPLMAEIYIFCFPIFFQNMSGISALVARQIGVGLKILAIFLCMTLNLIVFIQIGCSVKHITLEYAIARFCQVYFLLVFSPFHYNMGGQIEQEKYLNSKS